MKVPHVRPSRPDLISTGGLRGEEACTCLQGLDGHDNTLETRPATVQANQLGHINLDVTCGYGLRDRFLYRELLCGDLPGAAFLGGPLVLGHAAP